MSGSWFFTHSMSVAHTMPEQDPMDLHYSDNTHSLTGPILLYQSFNMQPPSCVRIFFVVLNNWLWHILRSWEGDTHIETTGMFCQSGSVFCKKSIDMDPTFHQKKIPSTGLGFLFFVFDLCIPQIFEKLVCFWDKIPRDGYLLLENSLEMGTYFFKNYP